jgi:hypothetical protein
MEQFAAKVGHERTREPTAVKEHVSRPQVKEPRDDRRVRSVPPFVHASAETSEDHLATHRKKKAPIAGLFRWAVLGSNQ